jgi:uncharacterized protein
LNSDAQQLCLQCGLCCNGVIFARGELQPGDDVARLRELGLRLKNARTNKFAQPCSALEGCRCKIYTERPDYCRKFECALLQRVNAGEVDIAAAEKLVRTAKRRADKVLHLLRQLGDQNEGLPVGLRFKKVMRQIEQRECSPEAATLCGELTLAMHQLNLLLSRAFYPH